MTNSDCIFCKIIAKEIPSDTVYEDDEVVIFRDIQPKAPTHLLIIPKQHIESIITINEETKDIPGMMIIKAKKFAEEKEIPGYKLTFHVGREGGQVVDHIHLHLLAEKKV
ncbi:HIT domain-containing protein [Candidatus Peribacteria bacterium]|jgi:histidine triad (HIT) family protein|nr:HIT domain-containing protein [Candidatus Peribacteria bacterium]MBT4021470.1 HIT domain-containing protein [Candidatus Peribacteria bacterium]MBT4240380.1 HIT domain-containing protein [Candidatus Peribacteria bacterium]MBT4473803.1 HIT domain-containing protein [Candidatus Peribacteria bacterium]